MECASAHVAPDGESFLDLCDTIHIDEKWFYIITDKQKVYVIPAELSDDEEMKKFYRDVQHKQHLKKMMFLAATARPRFDENGECTFDGKIGLFEFAEIRLAQRSSRNRPAGTPEWKPVKCTKETFKTMVLEKLLPAVREKFPRFGFLGGLMDRCLWAVQLLWCPFLV